VVEIANSPKISEAGTQEQQTNFEVDVAIQNPPASLRPGMTADVEIRTAEKDGVLTVPIQSVVVRTPEELKPAVKGRRAKAKTAAAAAAPSDSAGKPGEEIKGAFVIVNGVAQFRKLTTGITSDTDMEVAGDLKPGDKVITGPFRVLRSLKPEARVKIEEPKRPQEKK
jgi:HlyD family secretion protein